MCTIDWFHWDSVLDEAAVDVDHKRHWHTSFSTPNLCNLKRNCTIGCPKLSVSILVQRHFELEMLMPFHPLIGQKLPQHVLQRTQPEYKVLVSIKITEPSLSSMV